MSVVETLRDGAVLTIQINRPELRNALNEDVARGIETALDTAESDPDIRAVVLTGSGDKAFCAGGDLRRTADGTPFTIDPAQPRHYVARLLRRMDHCHLPLIARVNGHALAGGMGLVCACDLAVMDQNALIGVTEVKVGLFPAMILPYLLRMVPPRRVMELCITGEPVTGAQAAAEGWVNHAVPADHLDTKMDWLLGRIIDKSPTGIRLGKQGLTTIREMTTDSALDYAQFMLANMARTDDVREGFAAFAEKRKPSWTGR
ncbi:MAG: enoyl-CoA hydratase-related protein [Gemmobacter sp.]|nr:enoyl-CoA hydratase-related protein [Gemmobacter sp.]